MAKGATLILCCLATVGLFSCAKDVYKRPITVSQIEFENQAGPEYEEKFQKVNSWQLLLLDSLQGHNPALLIDTKTKKRYHKWSHTLVASLEKLDVQEGQPGLYYQLYLRPNSGIGRLKGGVQNDIYNHLKLYTPEENFFRHGFQYYKDSMVVGSFAGLLPGHELLAPVNSNQPDITSFSVDSISFPPGFNKRQQRSLMRILNNAFVVRQQKGDAKRAFNFYPNFMGKAAYTPADHTLKFAVTEDAETNKLVIMLNYEGTGKTSWAPKPLVINRKDFLDGHYYEAAFRVKSMVNTTLFMLQAASVNRVKMID